MTWDGYTPNPYDSQSQDLQPETAPPDEVIRQAIRTELMKMRCMLPAQIIKIRGEQQVDLQPLLKVRGVNGKVSDLPPIQNCPVSMLIGQGYSIKVPLTVGDTGTAFFSDRGLDVWLSGSGSSVDPEDIRIHDINDAEFFPGLLPFSKQTQDGTKDLVITCGNAQLRVQPGGTFKIKNPQNELIDLIDQITKQVDSLADTLSSDTVNTIFGPQKLNAFAEYAGIKSTLDGLIVKLETLKG